MKKIIAAVVLVAMAFVMVACSSTVNLDGTWTYESFSGMSVAEYAESVGLTEDALADTFEFSGSKLSLTSAALQTTTDYDVTLKSNGAEVLNTDGSILMSMELKDGKLHYGVDDGTGNVMEVVLVK